MLNTLLRYLGIPPNPKETQGSGNPNGVEANVAIETAKEAMNKLIDSTLAAVSEIREMVSSILRPLPEVIQKAWEGLCFVIGLSTTPPPNTVFGNATG